MNKDSTMDYITIKTTTRFHLNITQITFANFLKVVKTLMYQKKSNNLEKYYEPKNFGAKIYWNDI
jgi:hypothetical protein